MTRKLTRRWAVTLSLLAGLFAAGAGLVATGKAAPKKKPPSPVYVDEKEAGPDYKVQGEYIGIVGGQKDRKIGVQVIALGEGCFQAVFYNGGLPGAGWDGKERIALDGKSQNGKTVFEPSKARKKYMAQPPAEFSALRDNPPGGQRAYEAVIENERLTARNDKGERIVAERITRKSPTVGMEPPAGAIVLFDGTNADEWDGGKMDPRKLLCAGTSSKKEFTDFTLHVEFLTPFRPTARSQGRGNSGVYLQYRYEIQVLDSFGLEGLDNECGGIYRKGTPKLNMCLPPLTWQTYDVEFTAPQFENGRKVAPAVATIRHNGVVIHDKLKIDGKTGGSKGNEGEPGAVHLQGHGNPVFFRNIWIVPKK
jgi:hypothetical protein